MVLRKMLQSSTDRRWITVGIANGLLLREILIIV